MPSRKSRWLLVLLLVVPFITQGQPGTKTTTITIKCYGSDGTPVKDRLQYFLFRDGYPYESKSAQTEFVNGTAIIQVACGKPISIIVRGGAPVSRLFVPHFIQSIAVHENAPASEISLAMNRGISSIEGKALIKAVASGAKAAGPGSSVAKDLEEWAGEKAPPKKRKDISKPESKAIENCLAIIRECQLPGGAITMTKVGKAADSHVWVAPYFANYAVLALLAQNDRKKDPQDITRVKNWLEWCAKTQTSDGYWFDFDGTVSQYKSNAKVDAWDSSAALFLIVAERYQRAGGSLSPAIQTAARKALGCIKSVVDPGDGLTWASPTYKVKFLMDNIESYGGLVAASRLFGVLGVAKEAQEAREMALKVRAKLSEYWQEENKSFAFALHENGQFDIGLSKLYPDGLAQLFAISFVDAKPAIWSQLQVKFSPDSTPHAVAGPERWLVAASRMGVASEKEWRSKVATMADGFTSSNVYVYRPGIAVLGLLEGAEWMPSLFDEVPE